MDSQIPITVNGERAELPRETLMNLLQAMRQMNIEEKKQDEEEDEPEFLEDEVWLTMKELIESHHRLCDAFNILVRRRSQR
jgi:hypothetical protein